MYKFCTLFEDAKYKVKTLAALMHHPIKLDHLYLDTFKWVLYLYNRYLFKLVNYKLSCHFTVFLYLN